VDSRHGDSPDSDRVISPGDVDDDTHGPWTDAASPLPFHNNTRVRMTYRVIQWASAGVGRAACRECWPTDLDLVGAGCTTAEERRRPRTRCQEGPIGVFRHHRISTPCLSVDADCGSLPDLRRCIGHHPHPGIGQERRIRLAGFYPPTPNGERFDAVARNAGVTLPRHGHHPAVSRNGSPWSSPLSPESITHVPGEEFSDIRTTVRPTSSVTDALRQDAEEARRASWPTPSGRGFRQSV